MIQQYTHILWDWNGTLFDDVWLCVSVMNSLLERRNLPLLTPETYRQVFTFPVREYYQSLGFDFGEKSFEDLSIEFMEQYEARKAECSLSTNARALLAQIQTMNIGQTILSAYPYDGLVSIVRHFGLHSFFDTLLGLSDIYAHSKVELGRNWMQEQGYGASEVLLIGDTLHDFDVASDIGADCMLVASGHNSKARLQQCAAPVIDSLEEVFS